MAIEISVSQELIDTVMKHYLMAMEFTDFGPDEVGSGNCRPRMSEEMTVQVLRECGNFYMQNYGRIIDRNLKTEGDAIKQAGHDFWLTRNGHGAGFWDGDWLEPAASALDAYSSKAGPVSVYVRDDGLLYQMGG